MFPKDKQTTSNSDRKESNGTVESGRPKTGYSNNKNSGLTSSSVQKVQLQAKQVTTKYWYSKSLSAMISGLASFL